MELVNLDSEFRAINLPFGKKNSTKPARLATTSFDLVLGHETAAKVVGAFLLSGGMQVELSLPVESWNVMSGLLVLPR